MATFSGHVTIYGHACENIGSFGGVKHADWITSLQESLKRQTLADDEAGKTPVAKKINQFYYFGCRSGYLGYDGKGAAHAVYKIMEDKDFLEYPFNIYAPRGTLKLVRMLISDTASHRFNTAAERILKSGVCREDGVKHAETQCNEVRKIPGVKFEHPEPAKSGQACVIWNFHVFHGFENLNRLDLMLVPGAQPNRRADNKDRWLEKNSWHAVGTNYQNCHNNQYEYIYRGHVPSKGAISNSKNTGKPR